MLRSTTCSDWLINLLACSSGKLKLVAVLVLVVRTPAAVDHCCYCLVFLTGSFSAFALVRIDSPAPESTRDLTSRVLDFLSILPALMTSLKKIIGLKWTFFSFLFDWVCLSLLVGFLRVFNRWALCNDLSNLLELSVCYLMFDLLLGSNLSMINASLQPLSQFFPCCWWSCCCFRRRQQTLSCRRWRFS